MVGVCRDRMELSSSSSSMDKSKLSKSLRGWLFLGPCFLCLNMLPFGSDLSNSQLAAVLPFELRCCPGLYRTVLSFDHSCLL